MTIIPVVEQSKSDVLFLLQKANLPVANIDSKVELFQLREGDRVIGTIGLESDGACGLLRSLSVAEAQRGKGYGEQLVHFIESTAKGRGLQTMYLLTTTAASFFAKKGYEIIPRSEVPLFIQQTSEFSSVCPSSATIMKKHLNS